MIEKIDLRKEMSEERIIELWKNGLTIEQISRAYVQQQMSKGIKVYMKTAQKYIEPIIYKHQTNLLKK